MSTEKRYRIGYLDEDEGQKNSFYHALKEHFEVQLFSITDDTEIDALVSELMGTGLDVLVLDFRLDETGLVNFNADSIVDKIYEINAYYPLVILTSHELDALDHLTNANLVNGKEEMLGVKADVFRQKLTKIATAYKMKVSEAESELKNLEIKRSSVGLEPSEEDRYVELNQLIDKMTSADSRISRTFYSVDTNNRLDELIRLTEEMLKKIEEK